MNTVLITGGTGLVGKALAEDLLKKGYRVIILTRQASRYQPTGNLCYANWDLVKNEIDKDALAAADYIVHLAGAGVAEKRWTTKRKQEILDSRVNSGNLIAQSLKNLPNKVKAVISASAIGWYGPDPAVPNPSPFTETAKHHNDFLGNTCQQWEAGMEPVEAIGKRLVKLRIGIVLSKEGGALKEFMKPLRFGVAAILGSGKQIISWIYIKDLVKMLITAIENDSWQGVYNAVAPAPVSNKTLTLQLARSSKKFFFPVHVPAFILKWMLGEMSVEILKSATVSAARVQATGFNFDYETISAALDDVVK